MAKFFEGVEDSKSDEREWEAICEPRPARLALGADPKALAKRQQQTTTDRRLINMVNEREDSSDSDHEGSRAAIATRSHNNSCSQ
jgi:hypothetical protein